jgi:hypothetical protein
VVTFEGLITSGREGTTEARCNMAQGINMIWIGSNDWGAGFNPWRRSEIAQCVVPESIRRLVPYR